ncbi:hypothetical protein NUW58_g5103 [Xylaria curta]|uniref:Uncharacterized protein n=1 Tax=Xylaria curta TaxID=42375 RepID=A0ACC1P3A0_9PEZI|nr:hypothetical protein NUW58_g5103 [Xylaria curta]
MAAVVREERHENYLSIPTEPPASVDSGLRDVFIAHRIMRDDRIAEKLTEIEQGIEKIFGRYRREVPHPLHHWGVVVGGIIHHLQADAFFDTPNFYENKKLPSDEEYILYPAGTTTFNDQAIQDSGVAIIYNMPATYDPINNNCQRFTTDLIGLITRPGRIKVRTLEDVFDDIDTLIPGSAGYLKSLARERMLPEPSGLSTSACFSFDSILSGVTIGIFLAFTASRCSSNYF